MPMYEFICRECGHRDSVVRSIQEGPPMVQACFNCHTHTPMARDYSGTQINAGRGITEHYNPFTKSLVRNEQDMQRQLDQKSKEATEATGIEHRFKVHGPNEAPGVTEQGLDQTNSERSKQGLPPVKVKG